MRVYSAHKTAGRFAPKIINKKFRFVLKRGKCGSIFKTNLDIFIIFRETKAFFCEILLSLPLRKCGLKCRFHGKFCNQFSSLPLRKCGLKSCEFETGEDVYGHFPCGSVD